MLKRLCVKSFFPICKKKKDFQAGRVSYWNFHTCQMEHQL